MKRGRLIISLLILAFFVYLFITDTEPASPSPLVSPLESPLDAPIHHCNELPQAQPESAQVSSEPEPLMPETGEACRTRWIWLGIGIGFIVAGVSMMIARRLDARLARDADMINRINYPVLNQTADKDGGELNG